MPPNKFELFCERNKQDISFLSKRFSDYQPLSGVDKIIHIKDWLKQFHCEHLNLAIRLAKCTIYYQTNVINNLMTNLHQIIKTQIRTESIPTNAILYVGIGSAAESGNFILRAYRNVNRLHSLNNQFIDLHQIREKTFEIMENRLTPVIFFLDDFVGSGDSVCKGWEEISQLVPASCRVFLAVVVAFNRGAEKVQLNTPIRVLSVHGVGKKHQLMDNNCNYFTKNEKEIISSYCKIADNLPLGYDDHGLLISFAHETPNNTISVIRGSKGQNTWQGLLPRWQDLQ